MVNDEKTNITNSPKIPTVEALEDYVSTQEHALAEFLFKNSRLLLREHKTVDYECIMTWNECESLQKVLDSKG